MKIDFIPNEENSSVRVVEQLHYIEEAQPRPIKNCIPKWYKNLMLDLSVDTPGMKGYAETIKACRPVHEYLHSGYILPLWADHLFHYTDAGFIIAETENAGSYHHPGQIYPAPIHDYEEVAIKFMNPWSIRTPPGYSCLFMQPFYEFDTRWTIMPAIVNTDEYYEPIHFPALLKADLKVPFTVNLGHPLVHIFPFKREKWKSKIEQFKNLYKTKERKIRYYLLNTMKQKYHRFCGKNPSYN